jgi:hypothetical protein
VKDSPLPIEFTAEFLETVHNLIAYFILRQQLVVLAMVERNPRFVNKSLHIDTTPYKQAQYQRLMAMKQAKDEERTEDARAMSIWKRDWDCFPHGYGCKLTHLKTGEPIEWDAPDCKAFRIDWFLNHLRWRLENEADDFYVEIVSSWMKTYEADLTMIDKAINCLIDLNVIIIKQNHICKLAINVDESLVVDTGQLSDEVIKAALDSLFHYRARQAIAIEAMVSLRPDFIAQVANDPYTMPYTANRLKSLYQHLDKPPISGRNIQTGKWQEVWNYDIRYATCTLTHTTTEEIIRWSTSDPLIIDYHGYTQHLLWRLRNNSQDKDIQTIDHWLESITTNTPNKFSHLITLIHQLIADNVITLTRNAKGLLIKLNSPQNT